MMSYHNLPDHSRKRKERDEEYEAEYPHTPDYMMELHLARKKQATRFGIHTPLKHESVFDLYRGRIVRPLSCLSLPRPKQELAPFEQMPQEIMLNIVMCLREMTDEEVIDPRNPSLDILALHFTSKTLAAATLDQHNHVVGIDTRAAFKSSVNEFNNKFPLGVLACATCRMAKDIAVDGFDDNSFDLHQTQRQCLPCSFHLRIGTTISIHKVPYFLCTACASMKLTYGATWRQDARYPEWCSIRDKIIRACFDSPPHAELHGHADAQSRERVCKDCFIKARAIFSDQSHGCMCVRCTGQSASVILSEAADSS